MIKIVECENCGKKNVINVNKKNIAQQKEPLVFGFLGEVLEVEEIEEDKRVCRKCGSTLHL